VANSLQGVATTPAGNFSFCYDVLDDASFFDFECLSTRQYYFKSSFSTRLLQRMLKEPENVHLAPHAHKIFGVPVARDSGGSARCLQEGCSPQWPPVKDISEATTVLKSYSRGTSQVTEARNRLYRLILREARDDPALADFYITRMSDSGTEIASKRLPPGCEGPGEFATGCYHSFLHSALFMLNLQGIGLSMPFRPLDACDTGTAVVSEAFFPDAFADFPFYMLSFNSHGNSSDVSPYDHRSHFRLPWPGVVGEVNETALVEELRVLFRDHAAIAERLLPLQRDWCRSHYSEEAFMHTLFRHFKGAPFKGFLHSLVDEAVFQKLYG